MRSNASYGYSWLVRFGVISIMYTRARSSSHSHGGQFKCISDQIIWGTKRIQPTSGKMRCHYLVPSTSGIRPQQRSCFVNSPWLRKVSSPSIVAGPSLSLAARATRTTRSFTKKIHLPEVAKFRPSFVIRNYGSHNNMDVQNEDDQGTNIFRAGDKIQVEVVSFGPLGASVDVIGKGHDADDIIVNDQAPSALARGLIYQREIAYFRESRNNVDVVRGEVLPAYVEAVREDGKLDIVLRAYGGKAKADEVGEMILNRLEATPDGTLLVGDKSFPEDIAQLFPGVSKVSFKKAVASLYRQGLIKPGPLSISLLQKPPTIPSNQELQQRPEQQQYSSNQQSNQRKSMSKEFGNNPPSTRRKSNPSSNPRQ